MDAIDETNALLQVTLRSGFLSFVFLGGARRLELSPCNTAV